MLENECGQHDAQEHFPYTVQPDQQVICLRQSACDIAQALIKHLKILKSSPNNQIFNWPGESFVEK